MLSKRQHFEAQFSDPAQIASTFYLDEIPGKTLTHPPTQPQPAQPKQERERKKSTAKCSLNRNKCTLRNREPSVIVCYLSLNICTQIKYDESSRDRFSWYPFAGIRPLKPHYFLEKCFLLFAEQTEELKL